MRVASPIPTGYRRRLIAGLVCALLFGGSPSSANATEAEPVKEYKNQINGLCVAATPKLVRSARAVKRASTRAALIAAFDRYVAIGTGLDRTILKIPVPTAVRVGIAPFLRLTRQGDALVVRAADALRTGDLSLFARLGAQLDALGKTYDRIADALGLRACGSGITRALNRA